MRKLFFLGVVLALAAPAAVQGQDRWNGVVDVPVIEPGDSVLITVWRNPELSGVFLVATDGTIQHPLYRDVSLGGLPVPTAEERLGDYLKRYTEDPQFVLTPRFRVLVGGEVNRPGLYNFGPDFTVAQAIAAAGGPSSAGHSDRATLVRGGERFVVRLRGAGAEGMSIPVRSGDHLVVERRANVLREYILPSMGVVNSFISLIMLFLIL